MVLWRNYPGGGGHAAVILGIVGAVACVGAALLVAERVTRAVRPSIISFVTRVFGLLLSAIAVQLVVDGVRGLS
jgi:multiple antibiotic resistance protein